MKKVNFKALFRVVLLCLLCVQIGAAQTPAEVMKKLLSVSNDTTDVYIEAQYEWYSKKQPKIAAETLMVRMYLQGNEKFQYFLGYASAQTKEMAVFLNKESKTINVTKSKKPASAEVFSTSDLAKYLSQPALKPTLLPAKTTQKLNGIAISMPNGSYRNIEIWYEPSTYRIQEVVIVISQWNDMVGEFVPGDTLKIKYKKWQTLLPAQKRMISEFVVKSGDKWVAAPSYKAYRLIQ